MFRISAQKLFFNSDDEFYKFCVVPEIIPVEYVNPEGETKYYMDFNFTHAYNDAIKQGKVFIIKDPNSKIYKHQAVSYRTITKPIQNLEEYFDLL